MLITWGIPNKVPGNRWSDATHCNEDAGDSWSWRFLLDCDLLFFLSLVVPPPNQRSANMYSNRSIMEGEKHKEAIQICVA